MASVILPIKHFSDALTIRVLALGVGNSSEELKQFDLERIISILEHEKDLRADALLAYEPLSP